jgi:hypothetical protein
MTGKKPYPSGTNRLLKAFNENPNAMRRYNFSWYITDEKDTGKHLHSGSRNIRCCERDKITRINELLELIKKMYHLPGIDRIYFSVRRVQR